METFATLIRLARQEKGLLLRQVAAALDMDQGVVSKLERGERKPSRQQVLAFAGLLHLDPGLLLTAWLSDKIVDELGREPQALEALKAAEAKIMHQLKQENIQ
jgi:transcriptional regulator with XRE-family HTH domain